MIEVGTSINSNFETLFSKMDSFVSTKTVVGEPVTIGDVIIIPLIDVSLGVAAGSSENSTEKDKKDGGGGGLGAKISPTAVLVIQNGTVQLVSVKHQDNISKLIDMVPGIASKFSFFDKDKDKKNTPSEEKDLDDEK